MKRYILAAMAACTLTGAHAQQFVRFDSQVGWMEIPYSEFDGVEFLYEETPDPKGNDAVDLGLSVKWASVDYGNGDATFNVNGEQMIRPDGGILSPFADVEGEYPLDASGNLEPAYDIVRQEWGGCWRIPTLDEWKELKEKCTWSTNSTHYIVTGPNGNSIYLPKTHSVDRYKIHYWTSTGVPSSRSGMCVNIQQLQDADGIDRAYGVAVWGVSLLMVRPVLDVNAKAYGQDGTMEGEGMEYRKLVVVMKSGKQHVLPITSKPKMVASDGTLTITYGKETVVVANKEVERIYFEK